MNEQNDLCGTVVLVNPHLTNDPANKKNQVGVIVLASVEDDNIIVNFGLDEHASFSTDALLVLRHPDEIRRDAGIDATLLPFEDYYDILDIVMFADLPGMAYKRMAVELSMKNPNALEYTMDTLENVLGRKREQDVGR